MLKKEHPITYKILRLGDLHSTFLKRFNRYHSIFTDPSAVHSQKRLEKIYEKEPLDIQLEYIL